MKKLLALLIVCGMLATTVGCGSATTSKAGTTTPAQTEKPKDDKKP